MTPRAPDEPSTSPHAAKLQRWMDTVTALLLRSTPVTFDELAEHVPAYLADGSVKDGQASDTLKRMFERDKRELRELGVPIESLGEDGSDESAYRLRTRDFYLPYLGVVSERGVASPAKPKGYGYGSLPTLAFEPDELELVAAAGRRVQQLGDNALADEARAAMRKLAFDLPLEGIGSSAEHVVAPVARANPKTLALLGDALFRRKRVTFTYAGMGSGETTSRTVEPYGLFFLNGHWYLAAHDTERAAMRNFRVSRIGDAKANASKQDTPDYEISAGFSLREHARSRQAWELGDGDATEAVVELRGQTGAVMAAASLGREVADAPTRRVFDVRRTDSFARWLLSFAGEAVPVSPPALVSEYRAIVAEAQSLYAGDAS